MSDLIDRQAAIDKISEYASIWMSYTDSMTKDQIAQEALNSAKATMIRIVKDLPPAQPKIIHCGDCRYWKNDHLCECLSKYGTFETEIYFYCGFAERRTDE